jgi:hypothetical protein
MTAKELPSPETLRKLLRYEPETGKLFWREMPRDLAKNERYAKSFNSLHLGKEAFTGGRNPKYKQGKVFRRTLQAHRVIWAMQTGEWPKEQIDHIDRDKLNNRWENLRAASISQNGANKSSKPNSSSKYLGVYWSKKYKRWGAGIRKNGKRFFLGYYTCETEAARAYDAAAIKFHGEFANLNFQERIAA